MGIEDIKKGKSIQELLEFSIINIDKPQNPTSFTVSDFVRKTLNDAGIKTRKTSHFGTLDPMVTGVLPVALNRACKLTGFFMGREKEYIGIIKIHDDLEMSEIQKTINKHFLGKIKQTPPKKSSVKRQERLREVIEFNLLEQNKKEILFHTVVEAGTYIRKLISDLGEKMNVGMHMLELRRVRAGIFHEDYSVNLFDLEKAVNEYKKGDEKPLRKILIPGEIVSEIYSPIQVKEESVKKLLTGKPIQNEDLNEKVNFKKEEIVSVYSGEKFVGMYKVINDKFYFAKPEFVLQPLK